MSDTVLLKPPHWRPQHDYDPGWDYAVVDLEDVDPYLVEAFRLAQENASEYSAILGLSAPAIAFAENDDDDHVARFADGTEPHPVVIVFTPLWAGIPFSDAVEESLSTLLHELGHAYLRSIGLDYEDSEESVVELFARTRDPSVLDTYAEDAT